MGYPYTDIIRRAYRPEAAHRHVTALSTFHRIQGSPGFRAAAEYVAGQLAAAGLQVTTKRYPADGVARFWSTPSFLEWACERATLERLDGNGASTETLCDFAAVPISLIQRSIPAQGEFEVVAPGGKGGKDETDYDGLDVRGKIVLTSAPVTVVQEVAVRRLGAAGILFDGMKAGGRSELDLPDARQYTSFWWAGATAPDGWGFVVSPRQGQALRARLADGKPVRVRVQIASRFYAGTFEVVDALIPGSDAAAQEVLLVSHLCHPQPGAHDNGSGAAALIETAATLARLIADGALPQPRRGIRFIWPPEMTGTFAWLAEHEIDVAAGRYIAGLNLDMVGADQGQTGSAWQLVDLPQAAAGFADHLLAWLREPFLGGEAFGGGLAPCRHEETPFSAGSDHYILSDPTVGIPTPMLIQWPDKFYHTSADTPDRVSPDSLGRSGALAAVYACWLATAGEREAGWLARLMLARFATQAGRRAMQAAEAARGADSAGRAKRRHDHERASRFHSERMVVALESLIRLAPEAAVQLPAWRAAALAAAQEQDAWACAEIGGEHEPAPAAAAAAWRREAAGLIPRRLVPGPLDVAMILQADAGRLLPTYWELGDRAGGRFYEHGTLLQYWADGRRTIAEIAHLAEIETGQPADELVLRYFKLLAEAGMIEMTVEGSR